MTAMMIGANTTTHQYGLNELSMSQKATTKASSLPPSQDLNHRTSFCVSFSLSSSITEKTDCIDRWFSENEKEKANFG
jgi:hypothetical protein